MSGKNSFEAKTTIILLLTMCPCITVYFKDEDRYIQPKLQPISRVGKYRYIQPKLQPISRVGKYRYI